MEGDRAITISSDCISNAIQRARPLHGRTSGPTRRSTKGQWTPEEDEILRQAVQRFKGKNWKKIAECFKDRTDVQCLHRWQKVLNPELIKGPWSKEEDEVIIQLVEKFGPKKWSTIAQHLPGRIGKQCRERWHNHLNPAINKEAWTQEEELALIRAHQIYGNKWAELTKFLPGRTDNAIKNHWNSSVKKKLDQYLASGLLQQFQGLPLLPNPNPSSVFSSSKVKQCSEDDSAPKDGAELEEVSESSQGSTLVGCSQSTSDMGNAIVQTRDDCRTAEESSNKKDPSCSPPSCSENYLTAFQEVAFAKSDVPHELGGSSVFINNNLPHEWETSMGNEWQMNPSELTKMTSQDLAQESLEQFMQYLNCSDGHQTIPFPLHSSLVLSTGILMDESFPSGIDANGVDGNADPLLSNYQTCEDGNFASQSYYSMNTDMLATSYIQQPSVTLQLPHDGSQPSVTPQLPHDDSLIFGINPNQFNDTFIANQEQESLPVREDAFICLNESASSPLSDGMKEKMPHANATSKLVAVSDFCSAPSRDVQTSAEKDPVCKDEQKDSGALCYEPPRFPSLEMPFMSCDLIQSGTDMLQEYSPLGTRQFWTSINRLWDSPSGEKSPDAVLKSAAKSYLCTPSILKKRNRDLVSPLSEKRSEKKLESDLNQESFYNLSREFSRLDVMFDEVGNDKAVGVFPSSNECRNTGDSTEDKENINPDLGKGEKEDVQGTKGNTFSDCKLLTNDVEISAPHCEIKQQIDNRDHGTENEANNSKIEVEGNDAAEIVNQASGTVVEHSMDSLTFFSPDRLGIKSDRPLGLSVRALGNQYSRRLEAAMNVVSSSSEIPCFPVSSPLIPDKKDENNLAITRSVYSASSSTPVVSKVGISRDGLGVENLSIFVDTPFKRSIESPSAWKSPWFMSSYLLGSRVDADGTIEEFGHFLSPGDQSYDALGLMKQLSEQTASAFANAQEVLGDETPETLLRKKCSKNQETDIEDNDISKCQPEQHSGLASSATAERRTLDFSDCGTPGKGTETGKVTNAMSFSSPTSYLLKGCR